VTAIKVCGITRIEDAEHAVELGVEAIGINLWSGSARRCERATAREIVAKVAARARVVAIVVDATRREIEEIRRDLGIEWIQLHGDESDAEVRALLPCAYKAVRDEARAMAAPGAEVLLDASVPGARGGTGVRADWEVAARVAQRRALWLAGGLSDQNVGEAIAAVRPMGVDVASGVEGASPGIKDRAKIERFVAAVRGAR
jgi:phosphoribosylanthranilate isomerase